MLSFAPYVRCNFSQWPFLNVHLQQSFLKMKETTQYQNPPQQLIMEAMQIENKDCLLSLVIEKYHNRVNKSPLNFKKVQMLFVKRGSFAIAFQQNPEVIEDEIGYDRIGKITHFQYAKTHDKAEVVAITLKTEEKPTISFRVSSEEISTRIVDLINQKIREFNNLPDFTDLLVQKEQIIDKIKDSESQYREVYRIFENKIGFGKLRSILFENHRLMKDYMSVAVSKGFEIDKSFLLAEFKEMKNESQKPSNTADMVLEKYDIAKSLEGLRFQDDEKKLRFVPNADDVDDDLFFTHLPDVKESNIWDNFPAIDEEKMDIQSEEVKYLERESDVARVKPIILPKPVKGKFKISQSKEIFDRSFNRQDKRKEDRNDLSVDFAKKVALILKLFYKLSKYAGTTAQEMGHIENELHRILNSEPKPAPFLEMAINKAVKNILKWKRENHTY